MIKTGKFIFGLLSSIGLVLIVFVTHTIYTILGSSVEYADSAYDLGPSEDLDLDPNPFGEE